MGSETERMGIFYKMLWASVDFFINKCYNVEERRTPRGWRQGKPAPGETAERGDGRA